MTGQQLIDRWIAFVRRYVVLSEQQALVVALWAMNTWIYDHFPNVPFLEIAAATKRSGKTTLLDVLKMLTRNAEKFAIVRILTVLRMIEAFEGKLTILIDEAEQFSKPSLGEMRSGVATGYGAGAQHAVSVGKGFQRFRTFAPWAFAQIGNVHDVLRDRCIEIELERGKPERMLSEWDAEARAEANQLIADYALFVNAKVKDGKLHIPIVPCDWLHGRERQLWTPLYSLASFLGLHADTMRALQTASMDLGLLKTLPAKVWHSAQDESDAEESDFAEKCLADVLTVLTGEETFVPSAALVDRLRGIPTAPWRAWRGKGLNETLLAALLNRYGITPVQGFVGKGRKTRGPQVRGYKVSELRAAKR